MSKLLVETKGSDPFLVGTKVDGHEDRIRFLERKTA